MKPQLVPSAFITDLQQGIASLKDAGDSVRIISHYDADGACAAAIMCKCLMRAGKAFHATLLTELESIKEIGKEENDVVFFLDMGSGQIDLLETFNGRVIVLDHHTPLRASKKVLQINPHFYNINGTYEASASTISFLWAIEMEERNWDLVDLALAGASGDKQDIGGFSGVNKNVAEEGVKRGMIEVRRKINIPDGPLEEALTEMCEPYLKGIAGRREEVLSLLSRARVDSNTTVAHLEREEEKRLVSLICLHLLEQGARAENIEILVKNALCSLRSEMCIEDIAGYVNACGRMEEHGTGLAFCLGDREAMERAKMLRKQYRQRIIRGLRRIEEEGVFTKSHIQFFYTDVKELAGVQAGLSMNYLLNQNMPTLALCVENEKTSISARGTRYLVRKGLNLAGVCRSAAEVVGGSGGGHDIAAGATIPKGKEEAFLEEANTIVARQLS